jgi:hypothetical protein
MQRLLNRKEAAEYLNSLGLPSSPTSLARQAMTGSGAKYTLINRRAFYKPEWLDEWVNEQITPHKHSLAHMNENKGDVL